MKDHIDIELEYEFNNIDDQIVKKKTENEIYDNLNKSLENDIRLYTIT